MGARGQPFLFKFPQVSSYFLDQIMGARGQPKGKRISFPVPTQITSMLQSTYSSSSSSYLIFLIIIFLTSNSLISTTFSLTNCYDYAKMNNVFYCVRGLDLTYPFWSMDDQKQNQQQYFCGYPGLGITCSSNDKPIINISNRSYYVIKDERSPGRHDPQLTLVEPAIAETTCPRPSHNFTIDQNSSHSAIKRLYKNDALTFLNCTSPPPQLLTHIYLTNRSHHLECLDYNDTMRSYGFFDFEVTENIDKKLLADWSGNYCMESVVVPIRLSIDAFQVSEYMQTLQAGFLVTWSTPVECHKCENSGGFCSYNETTSSFNCWCRDETKLRHDAYGREYCFSYDALRNKILIGVFSGVGGLMFITLLFVYIKNQKKKRRYNAKNVELFLESYGWRSLQRYKYKDIKKMTNSFKDKLGQGGYGSVFKGKLVDGSLVAVKLLINDPKKNTNGEDFINEVATIGRTNHVNIVALLGFCSSGSKRALVYEFMPKGSLEKFIYAKHEKSTTTECITDITTTASSNEVHPLGWEKLYQIALGIARGLEYLHRGCNTGRILHFDIKPHNILLDENFCPKISDFGLAKLCPTRESIISMLSGGRGTIGYIAPEIYNRNFGTITYKSDVYSYGMMVLEMVGGRKNIDPFVENTSEIYFPYWIYNHLEKDKDKIEGLLKFEEALDEERAKKMIMVGLWCIQNSQADRPTMGKVAEMLEGNIKDLQMPPNPFMDSILPTPPTA